MLVSEALILFCLLLYWMKGTAGQWHCQLFHGHQLEVEQNVSTISDSLLDQCTKTECSCTYTHAVSTFCRDHGSWDNQKNISTLFLCCRATVIEGDFSCGYLDLRCAAALEIRKCFALQMISSLTGRKITCHLCHLVKKMCMKAGLTFCESAHLKSRSIFSKLMVMHQLLMKCKLP